MPVVNRHQFCRRQKSGNVAAPNSGVTRLRYERRVYRCGADVLVYADALTATPADVPDALFNRLRAAFSEPAMVELTAAIARENYRARFNRAFLIGSQGFAEGAFCAVPDYSTTRK
jgi:hypothetical protein